MPSASPAPTSLAGALQRLRLAAEDLEAEACRARAVAVFTNDGKLRGRSKRIHMKTRQLAQDIALLSSLWFAAPNTRAAAALPTQAGIRYLRNQEAHTNA